MTPIQNNIQTKAGMETTNNCPSETPVSAMANLEVRSRTKRSKLASSKSLTQFVPRSLFFLRKGTDSDVAEEQTQQRPKKLASNKLVTCRSFPSTKNVTNSNVSNSSIIAQYSGDESQQATQNDDNSVDLDFDLTPDICDRIDRLKAWPRVPSKSNSLKSKIFGESDGNKKQDQPEPEARENGLPFLGIIYNPQKGRFLFKRGNKFVNQRCRSKQPFTKLTNELATPSPTKLYSPFGIETPDTDKALAQKQAAKSKRKLDLTSKDNNKRQKTPDRHQTDGIESRTVGQLKLATSKEFTNFVSPTGKFRETVNYVEQSQRDIEAISKAIMTRSALNSNNLNGGR